MLAERRTLRSDAGRRASESPTCGQLGGSEMSRSGSYPQGFRIEGDHETVLTMNANHHETSGPSRTQQITLRGPAELADALPFMLGFHPTDSVVLVALHGERG